MFDRQPHGWYSNRVKTNARTHTHTVLNIKSKLVYICMCLQLTLNRLVAGVFPYPSFTSFFLLAWFTSRRLYLPESSFRNYELYYTLSSWLGK